MNNTFETLIRIANSLDQKGFTTEANQLDEIIAAMVELGPEEDADSEDEADLEPEADFADADAGTDEPDTGLESSTRSEVSRFLSQLLADTYLLYVKTQHFHWNVTGSQFQPLHDMFQKQYEALADATDLIAERIRALGATAPGSLQQFLQLATLKETPQVPTSQQMLQILLEDHETLTKTIRSAFPLVEEPEDQASLDLLIIRIQEHEKTAWMLRSLID